MLLGVMNVWPGGDTVHSLWSAWPPLDRRCPGPSMCSLDSIHRPRFAWFTAPTANLAWFSVPPQDVPVTLDTVGSCINQYLSTFGTPRKGEALCQCRVNAGPASATLVQQQSTIGSASSIRRSGSCTCIVDLVHQVQLHLLIPEE